MEIRKKPLFNENGDIEVSKKKMINGNTTNLNDFNNMKYKWASDWYRQAMNNFWIPEEINLSQDLKDYGKLDNNERMAYDKILSFLIFLDSIQTANLSNINNYVTASEINLCLTIQAFQEAVHSQSYSYMLDTICSPEKRNEILYQWKDDKVLLERNKFIGEQYNKFLENPTEENLIRTIMANFILEGIYFYSGFMFFYNLERNGKMPGSAQEIRYINRDENTHLWLFRSLIRELQKEEAEIFTKEFVEELRLMIDELDATGIICDDELSPAQFKNLEDELGVKVMDRTMVILDIFAARATSSEGKIQVEMAQLKYRSIRLAGFGTSMSRLGGGIGTRGPGEKKIETDRRLIRDRISKLSVDLKDMKEHRDVQRSKRAKTSTPVAAIVGYTNAGKSTLLNKLTDAGVLSENKLFATLDPTTRSMELPNGEKVLLTDTVGFIRKLPHNLIEAFKSTLEEAKYADIIVHVVDVSNPNYEQQMSTVYATLKQLGVEGKPVVTLFNKCDVLPEKPAAKDLHADYTYNISAVRGNGLEAFKECLQEIILKSRIRIERVFPYSEAGKIQLIRQFGQLESEEYTEDGIKVLAYVPKEIEGKL